MLNPSTQTMLGTEVVWQGGEPPAVMTSIPDGASIPSYFDHPSDSTGAETDTVEALLRPGAKVLGFKLVEKLGAGAFAEVFLAEQEALAGRLVVLKITQTRTPEPERLGRLQHPNIVPIHSVHWFAPFEILCMPYLGRQTLAEVMFHDLSTANSVASLESEKPKIASVKHLAANALIGDVRRVLKLISALSSGLDHAHSRGILHLDIKPGNVLLADNAEPMLFDFNLSHDISNSDKYIVGGTIPYMAPEQIEELMFRNGRRVDERSDLYSLGAMMYELLTGEHIHPDQKMSRSKLPQYLEQRKTSVPSVRDKNPKVSRAVDAIVRKLLDPERERRYDSARELKLDLDRELTDQPLLYARDRAPLERLGKWRRRNPKFLLRFAAALVMGTALGLGYVVAESRAAKSSAQAVEVAERLHAKMPEARLDLSAPLDPETRQKGLDAALQLLAGYGIPQDANWQKRDEFHSLPKAARQALAADLGELMLLVGHSHWQNAKALGEAEKRQGATEALQWNQRAESAFAPNAVPPFLASQREELALATGQDLPRLSLGNPKTARDHFLQAVGQLSDGQYQKTIPVLERVIALEAGHAPAHFALAFCRQQLGQHQRALERYDTAHALLPNDPRPVINRGLVFGLMGQVKQAEAEYSLAINISPKCAEAHWLRAMSRVDQAKWKEAEADLTTALALGTPALQAYAFRAEVRDQLRDKSGAEADREALKKLTPVKEADYLARGRSQLPKNPEAALADFASAAKLNPRSLAALQNQAHVWSDYLHDDARSMAAVSEAVKLHPDYAPAHAGQAVLLARCGKRAEAHSAAARALQLSDDALNTYQVAGVFAITSATHPNDLSRALELLRKSVRDGFRDLPTIETDPDLNPIRKQPEFVALLKALKDLSR
jgi:eukaryotic-like serine/threonine-protein kinase